MKAEDEKRFSEIMIGLAENFPGTRLSFIGIDARFNALQDYSIGQIEVAANELMRIHRYNTMPTVGDFIKVIDHPSGHLSLDDRAEIEAGKVLKHLRWYGCSRLPRFDDPVTRHLMNSRWRYSSWASWVMEADLKWWHREFLQAYKAHAVAVRAGYLLPARIPELEKLSGTIGKVIP